MRLTLARGHVCKYKYTIFTKWVKHLVVYITLMTDSLSASDV